MTSSKAKLSFVAGKHVFPVVLSDGGGSADISSLLSKYSTDKAVVVADTGCGNHVLTSVTDALSACGVEHVIVSVSPSENVKSLSELDRIFAAFFLGINGTRKSIIVALGGGIVANLAGFAAATIYRGVGVLHIPTTLLSAHDVAPSSLKQAINYGGRKNVIGAFHAPIGVVIDVSFLATLSQIDFRSGVGELVKNGIIFGGRDWEIAEEAVKLAHSWPEFNSDQLIRIVRAGIEAKQRHLRHDAFEKHGALVFEFGHTVGHALELLASKATHGDCVALGCLVACRISRAVGLLEEESLKACEELVIHLGPQIQLPAQSAEHLEREIIMRVRSDNKRGYIQDGVYESAYHKEAVPMVLLEAVGSVRSGNLRPLTPVDMSVVSSQVRQLLSEDRWFGPSGV